MSKDWTNKTSFLCV